MFCKKILISNTMMFSCEIRCLLGNIYLEYSNCASVHSFKLEFLPYTRNVAVWSDSLRNKFHIYSK